MRRSCSRFFLSDDFCEDYDIESDRSYNPKVSRREKSTKTSKLSDQTTDENQLFFLIYCSRDEDVQRRCANFESRHDRVSPQFFFRRGNAMFAAVTSVSHDVE